ncbi:MAG: bifunctional phosphopantothenoylcysteine decarboxylase/phosphopantothenate--cysteine ligase CoaBC [Syntrophales bacterium]|nr:bifunctional phosphopantothenoylcysteine decarboxylase/phosphopantothenate--cysteine ligase CoaBC [Syntrophales bacterium]
MGEHVLAGKSIVLGVTGGIAVYKAAELVRELVKAGASVRVVMTENATRFVSPLTFQVLSGNPVFTDMFKQDVYDINHISLTENVSLMVIAPATANVIGKIASGIADDLLTTTVMAMEQPVLICPAMNSRMYANAVVQGNIKRLVGLGYQFVPPGYGELACKTEGEGRLADLSAIMEGIKRALTPQDLAGQRVLVTAGPTREAIDPVRFISNHSTGKMGYAIAQVASRRGAEVVLVSGPTYLPAPVGVKLIYVSTAGEMRDAVLSWKDWSTVIIKAAAVADYRPSTQAKEKIKKSEEFLQISLERNPDILSEVAKEKGDRVVVGFAMETEALIDQAKKKLKEKNLDLICANDLGEPGAGFAVDTNRISIIDSAGRVEALPLMTKEEVAYHILDRVREVIDDRIRGRKGRD